MDAGRIVDPFATTPDPGAYVPRPASERAVAAVESALVGGARVVWLSGPPGIGKTLLLHRLRERLESRLRFVHMPYANVPPGGLWLWVGSELGVERGLEPRRAVRRWAAQAASEGTALVLAMDDAEALPDDTLQSLIATVEAEPGLRLVLVSGEELELGPVLPEGTPHVRFAEPMDAEETRAYVESRLARAGADSAVRARFDAAGVRWLYRESGGIPLLVNSLADRIARRQAGPPVADALAAEPPSEADETPPGEDVAPQPPARAEEPPPLETDGPIASPRREAGPAEGAPPAVETAPPERERERGRERASDAGADATDEGLGEILEGTRVGPTRPQAPDESFDFEPPWRAQRRTKGRKGSTSRPGRAARSRGRSRAAERRRGRGGRGGGGGAGAVILALAIGFLAGALARDALGPDPRGAVAELVAPRGPAAPGPVAAPPPQPEASPTPEAPEGGAAAGDVAAGSPARGAEDAGADAEGGAPTAGPPLQVPEIPGLGTAAILRHALATLIECGETELRGSETLGRRLFEPVCGLRHVRLHAVARGIVGAGGILGGGVACCCCCCCLALAVGLLIVRPGGGGVGG